MKNKFYNDFDFTRYDVSKRDSDYRTPFQIDRDRIIHSSEFRRLQGKTQVFLPGHYDFYRTRLTHSIEVAQIGRSICYFLLSKEKDIFNEEFYIDPDLVESICLSHDLGHPPFGHAGERTLNRLMRKYGGFEGNAQTLRLINEVFYKSGAVRRGMKPVRAFIDGIMKYKSLYEQLNNPHNHFLYNEQSKYVEFIFGGREIPSELTPGDALNNFKSIECQIMDWADDTAYVINDLVDSVFGGFISSLSLETWVNKHKEQLLPLEIEYVDELISWIKRGDYKAKFGSQIGNFIQSVSIAPRKTFMNDLTNRYKFELLIDEKIKIKSELYKRLSVELVFHSSNLHQMEYKGNLMLEKMFSLFEENYIKQNSEIKLLPDFSDTIIKSENNMDARARLVCDYIAGMTDAFAMRTYKRLFDPDYSSLADFV